MIVNELYDGQGLGNQLWNYVVARILAKNKQCDFSICAKERFKGAEFMELDFGVSSVEVPHHYKERMEFLSGTGIDISRTDPGLLAINPGTKFDGVCQSTKYLAGHHDEVISWIKIKGEYKNHSTDDNTCVIHIRTGDFKKIKGVFLPREYYLTAMKEMRKINKDMKFCCVTDEKKEAEKILPGVEVIGSALLGSYDERKAAHHRGGPIGIDFALIMNARYVIIPNSSFSWWAAYLNHRKEAVIAPKYWAQHNTSDGYWSTSDIITDSFTYLDRDGKTQTSAECWTEKNAYEAAHREIFSTAAAMPPFHDRLRTFIRRFI